MELREIKGIGPKRLELFAALHIVTTEDLLRFYPKEYLDYTQISEIRNLHEGDRATVRVRVVSDPSVFYYKGKEIVSVRVSDGTGRLTLRWLNQPYRLNQFHIGDTFFAYGTVNQKRGTVLYNPQINRAGGGIVPVYATVKGLTQTVIRDALGVIIKDAAPSDLLPENWREQFRLIGLHDALREIHFPTSAESLQAARRRLSFEDAFLYFTAVGSVKSDRKRRNGFAFQRPVPGAFADTLPFMLTEAQQNVMREIKTDMCSDVPMNRLIQGDVGSGKTVVAEYALYIAAQNGKQGVLLAPTELLAEQHFNTLRKRFPDAVLYTGSMKKTQKDAALAGIESGDASVIIGTHALLSDRVRFSDLGLVVTDEQHRFGVMQRAKIESKGIRPDVLVMSATPIPRTLALLIYADLDLSVIDALPPGRKPVTTHFVPASKRRDLYRHISACAGKGERAFVVCPLIEPTEGFEGLSLRELYADICAMMPNVRVGTLHGQMQEAEKDAAMHAFRTGETPVLVSTTVVEVGVDVPEATSMVIEGADHFGLATLHQLRGRVGRGNLESHCYLLANKLNDHAKQRIETLIGTSDGFLIAQKDFEMRGSGDLFGVRQSGEAELNGFLSGCTVETIRDASEAAKEVLAVPSLRNNALIEEARRRFRLLDGIAHN